MRELIFDDHIKVARASKKRAASTRQRATAHIIATKNRASTRLPLYNGTNSLGEPNVFIGKPRQKEFAGLRGYPLYATQTWLVAHGYTYEVT